MTRVFSDLPVAISCRAETPKTATVISRRACAGGLLAVPAVVSGRLVGVGGRDSRTLNSATQAAIDQVSEGLLAAHETPGLVVAVARQNHVVFMRGYGLANIEYAIPARPDAVFRVGSITKQFTAAAVMRFVEAGGLHLDDTVAHYLPEFPESDRFTLRQILSNTSGLANFQEAPGFAAFTLGARTTLDMLAYIADQRPRFKFQPGTSWAYSSSGFYLAGVILERVTGQPFGDALRDTVIAPAGLARTALDHDGDIVSGRVSGYDGDPAAPSHFANASYASLTVPGGAGGLRSTAADLIAWHTALFEGRILRPESIAEMTTPARVADGKIAVATTPLAKEPLPEAHYGLGLFLRNVDGRRSIGHAGGINGFSCFHESYPDLGYQLVVLANCNKIGITSLLPLSRALFKQAGSEYLLRPSSGQTY